MNNKLIFPNFYGIFEIKYCSKNKIRMAINRLKDNLELIEELEKNLSRITFIKNYKILKKVGSLSIEFDETQTEPSFIISIVLRLLNLEDEIFAKRNGKLRVFLKNLVTVSDISIYNKSRGLLDTKTLAAIILFAYGLKKIKTVPTLPGGATLIWWAFNILNRGSNR